MDKKFNHTKISLDFQENRNKQAQQTELSRTGLNFNGYYTSFLKGK